MHQPFRCLGMMHIANSGGQNFRFKVTSDMSRRVLHEKMGACMDKFVGLSPITIIFFFSYALFSSVFASVLQSFRLVIKLSFFFFYILLVIICFILNNL
jgi:hypothetical protein